MFIIKTYLLNRNKVLSRNRFAIFYTGCIAPSLWERVEGEGQQKRLKPLQDINKASLKSTTNSD